MGVLQIKPVFEPTEAGDGRRVLRRIFSHGAAVLGVLVACGMLMPAPQAEARLGTGIGISLPMGGHESTVEGAAESYAALTEGQVIQELTVRERGGRLFLTLRVTNNGDTPYTIAHRDGQVFDFALLDENGKALWHWSDGMAFTQALTSSSVAAHKSEVYKAEIARKDYRKIKDEAVLVTAWLTDTPTRLSTRIPHVSRSGSAAVYGTIVIGNGHYWDD